jgi:hypothetical protein
MNRGRNTAVSILIALTPVLPCVAQTSQAEKEILELEQKICRNRRIGENVDCFHHEWSESKLSDCPICMCR